VKKQNNQSGFAHLGIVVIILTIALIGTLGFVFYQNFIQNKDNIAKVEDANKNTDPNNNTSNDADKQTDLTYSDKQFNFSYPKTGWLTSLEQETYATDVATLKTTDYNYREPNPSVDGGDIYGNVTRGAIVTIYKSTNPKTTTADVYKMLQMQQSNSFFKELSTIVVDGQTAYNYLFAYEGPQFYQTVFVKNGYTYYVTYKYVAGQSEINKAVYESVLDTLIVK